MTLVPVATGRHHAPDQHYRHARPRRFNLLLSLRLAGLLPSLALIALYGSTWGRSVTVGLCIAAFLMRLEHHRGERHRTFPESKERLASVLFLLRMSFDLLVVFLEHLADRTPTTEVPVLVGAVVAGPPTPPPATGLTEAQREATRPRTDREIMERHSILRIGGEPRITAGSWERGLRHGEGRVS